MYVGRSFGKRSREGANLLSLQRPATIPRSPVNCLAGRQVALQLAAQPRQDAALRIGWLKTYLRPKMRLQYNMEASGPAKWVRWQRMLC